MSVTGQTISQLNPASLPLSSSDIMLVVQGGVTKRTTVGATNLGFTVSGQNYVSYSGTVLTANPVNLSNTNVTGTLPANKGGTGVANNASSTITISGAFGLALTLSAATSLTLPVGPDTLVGRATTDTLTNKTLTLPVIASISNSGTLTLPTGPDTLVGRVTTDTLTNKTLTAPVIATISNGGTITIPTGTDTLVGKATTDTFTNKTFNTAGTGNVFQINGTGITTVTGSGSAVLATSPSLTTPTLGAATATSINKVAITAPTSSATLALADGSSLVTSGAFSITLTSTAGTNVTLPTSGTLVNSAVTSLSSLATVGTITSGTWNAGAVTSSGAVTGTSFVPTSNTIPTNGLYLPVSNAPTIAANSWPSLQCTYESGTGTPVNSVRISNAGTGFAATIESIGTDSAVSLVLCAQGAGSIILNTNGLRQAFADVTQFTITHTASSTRSVSVTGSNGGAPVITTTAGDLAIGSASGLLQFVSSGSFSANNTVATVLGSVGPTGAHTTVQNWLTFKDSGGTTRYVPCF